METTSENKLAEKKAKAKKSNTHAMIPLKRETQKRVAADMARVNRKDYGRTVRIDEYIALAISLITPEHIRQLQEASLSHKDRFEREYREYVASHTRISRDEYLGKRLSGEIPIKGSSECA
ncbi:hypothetical protein WDW86_05095 [Bdellovibrionota bacterium FG-2]